MSMLGVLMARTLHVQASMAAKKQKQTTKGKRQNASLHF
jgi:hypothetical protein